MSADGFSPGRILGAVCVCLLVTLSACTATVDSSVSDENTISRYVLELEMDGTTYSSVETDLREQGYGPDQPIKEAFLADLDATGSQVGDVQYESKSIPTGTTTPDRQRITLTVTDFSPSPKSNVTLWETSDGLLIYEDRMLSEDTVLGRLVIQERTYNFRPLGPRIPDPSDLTAPPEVLRPGPGIGPALPPTDLRPTPIPQYDPVAETEEFKYYPSIEARYRLTMPYEIVETNADETFGPNTAEWYRADTNESFTVEARSRVPVPPEAYFTVSAAGDVAVVGEPTTFDASDSTDDVGVTGYHWDFGDGNSDDRRVATNRYASPGEYSVVLTVVDEDGLSDTESRVVSVEEVETATASPTPSPTRTATETATATPESTVSQNSAPTEIGMEMAKTATATPEPTNPADNGGGGPQFPWLWLTFGLLGLVALAGGGYFLTRPGRKKGPSPGATPAEPVPPVPPAPEWSGLVIEEVRRQGEITDIVVRNATPETWTAAGKTIEDAHGNRNPLPETLGIAPGATEILRFDRGDDEIFASTEGEDVLLHTDEGEQTIRWEEPGE